MTTLASLPPEVTVASVTRIVLFAVVLAAIARVVWRFPTVLAGLVLGLVVSALTLLELREVAALVSMPYTGLTAWIYVDRCRNDPATLRALLAAEQAKWSHERHELRNELAAEQARRLLLERERSGPGAR